MKLYEPDLKYIGSGDYIPIMVEVADIEEDEEYYVRQTDYAALARNARIVEWMRGRCEMGDADSRIQDDHDHNELMKFPLYRRVLQDFEYVRTREGKTEAELTAVKAELKVTRTGYDLAISAAVSEQKERLTVEAERDAALERGERLREELVKRYEKDAYGMPSICRFMGRTASEWEKIEDFARAQGYSDAALAAVKGK